MREPITSALNEVAAGRDLVHLHSNGLIIEVASAWARRRHMPAVLTLYGTEIWHYRRRWPIDPFTRAYMNAAAVTFYSQRLLDRALELGLKRPGLSVVYPPVSEAFVARDPDARADWRRELGITEPLVVLNVKRLHELAGQRYLIEAFARVARHRHDVRLIICGTGPLKHDLEERASVLGVSAKVTFTGLVANDLVARYAAIADVFVLPSLLEALPTVAVEALAAGTPVISADHPGGLELNELFGDDVSIVPRQNSEALADTTRGCVDQAAPHAGKHRGVGADDGSARSQCGWRMRRSTLPRSSTVGRYDRCDGCDRSEVTTGARQLLSFPWVHSIGFSLVLQTKKVEWRRRFVGPVAPVAPADGRGSSDRMSSRSYAEPDRPGHSRHC